MNVMGCIEWVFSGIGTSILMLVIGLVIGAPAGYYIGVKITIRKNKVKQAQSAGDNSTQIQVGGNYDGN